MATQLTQTGASIDNSLSAAPVSSPLPTNNPQLEDSCKKALGLLDQLKQWGLWPFNLVTSDKQKVLKATPEVSGPPKVASFVLGYYMVNLSLVSMGAPPDTLAQALNLKAIRKNQPHCSILHHERGPISFKSKHTPMP